MENIKKIVSLALLSFMFIACSSAGANNKQEPKEEASTTKRELYNPRD